MQTVVRTVPGMEEVLNFVQQLKLNSEDDTKGINPNITQKNHIWEIFDTYSELCGKYKRD